MAIDVVTLILETVLKINTDLLYKYTALSDQLIYLILIPNVVILMFLWMFGYWIIPTHKGLRILLSTVAYIYIVWSGWYGGWMVSIINAWFPIMIGAMFIFFIITRLVSPASLTGVHGIMSEGASKLRNIGKREKDINKLREELRRLEIMKANLESQATQAQDEGIRHALGYRIVNVDEQIREIRNKIRQLES